MSGMSKFCTKCRHRMTDHEPRMVKLKVIWNQCTLNDCKCEKFRDPDEPVTFALV